MANKAKAKVQKFGDGGMHIYVPATVREDSQNPLKIGAEVMVSVDGERMIIEPFEEAPKMNENKFEDIPLPPVFVSSLEFHRQMKVANDNNTG
jgi:hypothetical protein